MVWFSGVLLIRLLQNWTMRWAASRPSSTSATSAMRMRPWPGIDAVRVAREVAARQDGDIIFGVQAAGEFGVGQAACRATSAHR